MPEAIDIVLSCANACSVSCSAPTFIVTFPASTLKKSLINEVELSKLLNFAVPLSVNFFASP